MSSDQPAPTTSTGDTATVAADTVEKRRLTPEAERALAEAAERRSRVDDVERQRPREIGGRPGPDPTRYGDWENGGIASDF